MRSTYTHHDIKRMKKEKLIIEVIKMAAKCKKELNREKLNNYSEVSLYNKYLKYRNEYILFHK